METTIDVNNTIEVNDDIEEDNVETTYETPAKKKTKRTRKIKPLPEELAVLKDCAADWEKFSIAKEADGNNKSDQFGKEMSAVQSVRVMKDGKEVLFDLRLLNVDQI
jgi:hypothetical protein